MQTAPGSAGATITLQAFPPVPFAHNLVSANSFKGGRWPVHFPLFLPVNVHPTVSHPRRLRRCSAELGCLVAIAGMILWFARGIVWRGELPFFRDLSTYFYPMRFALWQAFHDGELPLWNRHYAIDRKSVV